jgi:hypothetical protein
MKLPNKAQKELSAICTSLFRAVDTPNHEECREIVQKTIRRIKLLAERLAKAPSEIGKKGGTKTAERGPEYFRQIAAMRKTKAGGRPKKQVAT